MFDMFPIWLTLFFTDEAIPVGAGVVIPETGGGEDGATILVPAVVVGFTCNHNSMVTQVKMNCCYLAVI